MTTRVNFEAALTEFANAERAYLRLVARAGALAHVGQYTPQVQSSLQKISDQLHRGEVMLAAVLRAALPEPFASRIPEPMPLPVPGVTAEGAATMPTGTSGLAAVPLIVWALAALAIVVQAGVIGYLGASALAEFFAAVKYAIGARENTERYGLQLAATERRFAQCMKAGGTPESCAAVAPLPAPPLEEPPPTRTPTEWLYTGAAIVGIAWASFEIYRFSRRQRRKGLSGGDAAPRPLPSRGRARSSGYQMRVR